MTPEQLAVIQAVHETGRSLTVQSTAGSGKSTVLRTVAQVLPAGLRIGAFALNKSIAKSLKDALPSDVQVSPFHAFGKMMVEECSPRKATFSEWKRKHLVDSLRKERGLYSKGVAKTALALVKLSMAHIANTSAAIEGLVSEHEMEWPAGLNPVELVRLVQDRALSDVLERGHSDDDMLYLPLKLGYGFESMDVVLVEETQDFFRLQHRLVKHVTSRRGRVVLVGDRAQAICKFTGADAEGLDWAQETFNALSLRLTVTFRCPRSHVALVSEFSDLIVTAPHAAEGEVKTVSEDELLSEL
ncbi:UvrD-helicase domain-containing protein [Deinococcus aquatilis]|uniref:UvrD-helicase domain-containing protein n=1 Tax=Deinococcus aquatilis TaxID=519440 RepID=UPI00036B022F|nr:UvrD-helicase domain-containing protein [Deinococcus aquatilis]